VVINSAFVQFHPAAEPGLDTHRGVHSLEVRVLDVLLDLLADVEERPFVGGAAARRLGLGTDALDNLARFLEDRLGLGPVFETTG